MNRDAFRFSVGAIAGFLTGFFVPLMAAASLVGLTIALFKAGTAGETGDGLLGQIASVAVSAAFVGLFSFIWSKIDHHSHFGEGFVKGGLAGLLGLFIGFVILSFAGGPERFFPDL